MPSSTPPTTLPGVDDHGEDDLWPAATELLCPGGAPQHKEHSLLTVSAEVHGFSLERASRIVLREMNSFLERNLPKAVMAVCFCQKAHDC